MVLFSSVFLVKSDMSVDFQQLLAVLDVFRIACAVHLCSEARNFSPANAPCTSPTSWPPDTLQTGKVSQSERLLTEICPAPLIGLGPSGKQQNGSCKCLCAHIFPSLTCPRATQWESCSEYHSGVLPTALCWADTAICKEFTFQDMPVPMYLKITTSQQEWMQSALLNAWVHSYNWIIQCCELPLLRQCVLDIDCTEGQLVLEKQTGCFA